MDVPNCLPYERDSTIARLEPGLRDPALELVGLASQTEHFSLKAGGVTPWPQGDQLAPEPENHATATENADTNGKIAPEDEMVVYQGAVVQDDTVCKDGTAIVVLDDIITHDVTHGEIEVCQCKPATAHDQTIAPDETTRQEGAVDEDESTFKAQEETDAAGDETIDIDQVKTIVANANDHDKTAAAEDALGRDEIVAAEEDTTSTKEDAAGQHQIIDQDEANAQDTFYSPYRLSSLPKPEYKAIRLRGDCDTISISSDESLASEIDITNFAECERVDFVVKRWHAYPTLRALEQPFVFSHKLCNYTKKRHYRHPPFSEIRPALVERGKFHGSRDLLLIDDVAANGPDKFDRVVEDRMTRICLQHLTVEAGVDEDVDWIYKIGIILVDLTEQDALRTFMNDTNPYSGMDIVYERKSPKSVRLVPYEWDIDIRDLDHDFTLLQLRHPEPRAKHQVTTNLLQNWRLNKAGEVNIARAGAGGMPTWIASETTSAMIKNCSPYTASGVHDIRDASATRYIMPAITVRIPELLSINVGDILPHNHAANRCVCAYATICVAYESTKRETKDYYF
ncbi:hypothetical protein BDZ91DRAFT_846759 [Kalaharituber pfeilii]|nr:hypothetical protein BDZ91DRAFT_846759 [Kalaharituber pfeilii]